MAGGEFSSCWFNLLAPEAQCSLFCLAPPGLVSCVPKGFALLLPGLLCLSGCSFGSSMAFARDLLDFDVGKRFENDLYSSTGLRIHGRSRRENSFLLIDTFKRYLFQLTEDSVALALHSCLGGFESDFQVEYQSHNHYRFSISCKAVGFAIYKLRRFVGKAFDVYFHLWSNGAPHWEREKRIWEAEEAKKWSLVLSKKQKRVSNPLEKRKRFALLRRLFRIRRFINLTLLRSLNLSRLVLLVLIYLIL
jgi:hypothetical protein